MSRNWDNAIIISPQIRAGRVLLGWSQEQLAKEAEVGISTVRLVESESRAADAAAIASIRRALWNGGVVFTAGRPGEGPGVRLVADRPNIIRRPTTVDKWEGIPFTVEWQGKVVMVFVAFEVIDDLGGHRGNAPDDAYLRTFEQHRAQILDAIAVAIIGPANFDNFGRLHIRQKDLDALKGGEWHQVVINGGEDSRDTDADALMNKFASLFVAGGIPPRVEVYQGQLGERRHVYYFSPVASDIAKDLLSSFHATLCTSPLDLSSLHKVKLERDRIRESVAPDSTANGGYHGGKVPWGFAMTATGALEPVPEQQVALIRAKSLRAAGASLQDIRDALASDGVKISITTIARLTANQALGGKQPH